MKHKSLPYSWKEVLIINTSFWTVLWLFSIWNNYQWNNSVNGDFTLSLVFSWSFPQFMTMVFIGPAVYLLYNLWDELNYGRQFLLHMIPALITGFLHQLSMNSFSVLFNKVSQADTSTSFMEKLAARYDLGFVFSANGFLFYWLCLGVFFLLILYRYNRQQEILNLELKADLNESKLQSLQSQLQPHFLFNTFNTIAMMARKEKNKEVVEMIGVLGDLLRQSLDLRDTQMVTIEEELKLTKKYLQLQHVRLRDRLTIDIQVPTEFAQHKVPCLLFQPIIENAFQHGLEKLSGPINLQIIVGMENSDLVIRIINDGSLDSDFSLEQDKGIGLSNTLSRLEHAFQKNFRFELVNDPVQNKVVAQIKLPGHD